MKKIILLCSLIALAQTAIAADTGDMVRECDYEVRTKSNSAGLGSKVIDGGEITSHGSHVDRDETTYGGRDKRLSRKEAAKTAQECLLDAINTTGKPQTCHRKARREINGKKYGAMKIYSIRNLKQVAQNELCQRAANNGSGNTLHNFEVYAINTTSSRNSTRRKECKFPGGETYLELLKGTNLQCENGHVKVVAETRLSGYYDKSATQLHTVIRDHCYNNNNASYNIEYFEVERNTGKIRAMFSCQ